MIFDPSLASQSALVYAKSICAVIGDSIMASETWPLGNKGMVNLAIDGAKLADMLSIQLPELARVEKLGCVVFMGGTNDAAAIFNGLQSGSKFQTDLASCIYAMLKFVAPEQIIACTPPPPVDPRAAQLWLDVAAEYPYLCNPLGIEVFTTSAYLGSGNPPVGNSAYFVDGIHLNGSGWSLIMPILDQSVSARGDPS